MQNVVLVVDPNPEALESLVQALEDAGFHCLTATTGSEALRTATGYSPQLVILPPELPELEASEVCLRIKQDEGTSRIAIVMRAKDRSIEDRFVGEQVGADAYLVEPTEENTIVETVHSLFERHNLNPVEPG